MKIVKGAGRIVGEIRKILLIQLGDIGDVVLSFPCIVALQERYPQAQVVVAVRDKAAGLLDNCPGAGVLAVRSGESPAGQWRFIRQLRGHHFDLAIDLRTGTRGAILARLSGAPVRLGYYADDGQLWRNRLFTDLVDFPYTPDLHVIDHLLGLLEPYEISTSHRSPVMVLPDSVKAAAIGLLARVNIPAGTKLVALQPFSLWRYKELAEEKYVELIKMLHNHYQLTVVVTGSAADRERAGAIVAAAGEGCLNLAGRTSIELYAALLANCELFIGMDSAGLHLAAAVGTPTASIFGPSSPISWAPRGVGHLLVRKDWPCLPCRMKGCDGLEKSRCLDELEVSEIWVAVRKQLAGKIEERL